MKYELYKTIHLNTVESMWIYTVNNSFLLGLYKEVEVEFRQAYSKWVLSNLKKGFLTWWACEQCNSTLTR